MQMTTRRTTTQQQQHGETHGATSVQLPFVPISADPDRLRTVPADVEGDSKDASDLFDAVKHGEIQNKGPIPISDFADTIRFSRISLPRTSQAQVIVHYAVPQGQRYLPITLNNAVTMHYIGAHDDHHVYEPVNDWLQSLEEGLRYHRSIPTTCAKAAWTLPNLVSRLSDRYLTIISGLLILSATIQPGRAQLPTNSMVKTR
jgi:hypothetical protein